MIVHRSSVVVATMVDEQSLEDLDKFMDELGIDVMTPSMFASERLRLEQRFMETYHLAPEMINPTLKDFGLPDCDLVQEWLELMVFEPYMMQTPTE
jgi:hypothetical protein